MVSRATMEAQLHALLLGQGPSVTQRELYFRSTKVFPSKVASEVPSR